MCWISSRKAEQLAVMAARRRRAEDAELAYRAACILRKELEQKLSDPRDADRDA